MSEPRRPTRVYTPELATVRPSPGRTAERRPAPRPGVEIKGRSAGNYNNPRSPNRAQDFLSDIDDLCGEAKSGASVSAGVAAVSVATPVPSAGAAVTASSAAQPRRAVRIENAPALPAPVAVAANQPPAQPQSSAGMVTSTLALALFMAAFGVSAILYKEPPPQTEYIVTKVQAPVTEAAPNAATIPAPRRMSSKRQPPADTDSSNEVALTSALPTHREVVVPAPQLEVNGDSPALSEELADALASLQQRPCDSLRRARAGAALARFRAHEFERQADRIGTNREANASSANAASPPLQKTIAARLQALARMGVVLTNSEQTNPAGCAPAAQASARTAAELWQPPVNGGSAAD